eukprot:TRINITY_DN7750_c0_g1_i1.p1 TRINITY_DN7750_c0_g1~~TRINITY_DN7750_c0_g1_i1.p1  ORF type:complete len:178 (+),score=7.15 TRINITY_DN7750_c0_g1_i1:23-535(+)
MSPNLTSCWTPCFWFPNVRSGSYASAFYTFFTSIFCSVHTIYVMRGGDASQVYLPFFETDLNNVDLEASGGFTIFYFVLMCIASIVLAIGVKVNIRGLMIPWMLTLGLAILFQAMFGLWLIFGYYIYLEVILAAVLCWTWMSVNIYALQVVRSHYYNIKYLQSPDIEYYD